VNRFGFAPGGVFLAWAQLRFERRRLLAALCGIVIVTMSTLFQTGVYRAFFESAVGLFRQFNADLVVISTDYRSVLVQTGFPSERVFQTLSHPAVDRVSRACVLSTFWRNPENQSLQDSLLIGIHPSEQALRFAGFERQKNLLKSAETVLFDSESLPVYGPIGERLEKEGPFYAEMGRQRVRLAGTFSLGPSFALPGNFMTSLENFYRLLPIFQRGTLSFGLVTLKPGHDPKDVAADLGRRLPGDVRVLTLPALIRQEQHYWNDFTAIGFIIPMSLVVSLIVGGVVIYQILYTNVNDQLKQYATLKAIGYTDRALAAVVLQQSLLLSVIGFVPGMLISFALFRVSRLATGLPFELTFGQLLLAFVLTAGMCFIAGLLALGKLRQADPAEVFG
jgi:putative ABC transport system permease protein